MGRAHGIEQKERVWAHSRILPADIHNAELYLLESLSRKTIVWFLLYGASAEEREEKVETCLCASHSTLPFRARKQREVWYLTSVIPHCYFSSESNLD